MPERVRSSLKGGFVFEEKNHGAHYYAFSPRVPIGGGAYTKVSTTIILPTNLKTVPNASAGAQYKKRHAFISLGVGASEIGWGIDLGIINMGTGWHPVYYDTAYTEAEKLAGAVASKRFDGDIAPSNAAKVAIAIMPLSRTQVKFYVQFMSANGVFLGSKFEKTIDVKPRTEAWARFYRFASLVQESEKLPDVLTDSTYMTNGQFTDLKITKSNGVIENWGITTDNVDDAWIMSHPKCQVLTQSSTHESFSIDHWE